MKAAVAESLLLAGLLLLSAIVLWGSVFPEDMARFTWPESTAGLLTEYLPGQLALGVSLCLLLYWGLHALGFSQTAFWLMVLLIVLLHMPGIWAHNQLDWFQFFEPGAGTGTDRSQGWDTTWFLVALIGLITLHRLIGLRKLKRQMVLQGIGAPVRDRLVPYEGFLLLGLVVVGLLVTLLMIFFATMLSRFDALLDWSPWAVVTVGGAATLLLAFALVLWFRGRQARLEYPTSQSES